MWDMGDMGKVEGENKVPVRGDAEERKDK